MERQDTTLVEESILLSLLSELLTQSIYILGLLQMADCMSKREQRWAMSVLSALQKNIQTINGLVLCQQIDQPTYAPPLHDPLATDIKNLHSALWLHLTFPHPAEVHAHIQRYMRLRSED